MSRRQLKLDPAAVIRAKDKYVDTLLTFVMKDRKSILARIEKIEGRIFQVRNTMHHKISLDLRDIREVWIDEKARE